jgi:hypothetical protein
MSYSQVHRVPMEWQGAIIGSVKSNSLHYAQDEA